MPLPLAPVVVTAGQTYPVYVGTPSTVGALVIANESPYAVNASAGSGGQWIVAQTADLLPCDNSAFSGTITLTTDNYLSNANDAPSFQLYLTAYAPGEPIRGTYPAPLVRLTTGTAVTTNNPATTIEQDLLTPFVLSGLVPSQDGTVANQLDVTAGVAFLRQSDSSLLRQAPAASTHLTSTPNTTYFLDLNPDGSWSWGTSHSTQSNYLTVALATTDANGNILVVGDERTQGTTLLSGAGGVLSYPSGLSASGALFFGSTVNSIQSAVLFSPTFGVEYRPPLAGASALGHFFDTWSGTAELTPFSIGGQVFGALSWIDNAGVVHASAPPTLITGNQETGSVGGSFTATAAGQRFAYVQPFKTHMTNTPTSITLNVTTSSNFASVSASQITKDGFLFLFTATAAGISTWIGTYTTVGN